MRRRDIVAVLMFMLMVISLLAPIEVQAKDKSTKSKSVELDAEEITLAVGNIAKLSATMNPVDSTDTFTWKSSKKKVASVTANGVIRARKKGTAKITVTTSSGKKATCKITVKKYLTEDDVVELLKKDVLTEDSVKKLIKDNTLSENAVKELVKKNTLTETKVKELVQKYSLTEEKVREIASQYSTTVYSSSGGGTTVIYADANKETPWADGTALTINSQTLPLTKQLLYLNKNVIPWRFEAGTATGGAITFTQIDIRKYHHDECFQVTDGYGLTRYESYSSLFKYDFYGTISNNVDMSQSVIGFDLIFTSGESQNLASGSHRNFYIYGSNLFVPPGFDDEIPRVTCDINVNTFHLSLERKFGSKGEEKMFYVNDVIIFPTIDDANRWVNGE